MWSLILTFFSVKIFFAFCDTKIEADKDSVYNTWTEDLFGTGLTEDIITKESKRHIASSTEDLKILFNDEQLILQTLLPESEETELYLKEIGNLTCAQHPEYVLHPVNAFHLMKRSFQWWPKLIKKFHSLKNIRVPEKMDFIFGASYGMLSIWAFHDLNILDLAKGQIIDPKSQKVLQACKELSPEEMSIIGLTAKKIWKLNGHVEWLKAALQVSKLQKRPKTYQTSLKKSIKK